MISILVVLAFIAAVALPGVLLQIPTTDCTPDDLKQNTGFGCIDCLSAHDKQAMLVWALCLEAAALTHTACDLEVVGRDSTCFNCESDSALDTMTVINAMREAAGVGARVLEDIDAIKQELACLSCVNLHFLRAMEVFLRCVISNAVSNQEVL